MSWNPLLLSLTRYAVVPLTSSVFLSIPLSLTTLSVKLPLQLYNIQIYQMSSNNPRIVIHVLCVPVYTFVNICSSWDVIEVPLDPSTITTLALCSGHLKPSLHTDIGWLPSLKVLDANTQGTITSLRVSRSPDRTRTASVYYQVKIRLMSATSEPTFKSIVLPLVIIIGAHLLRVISFVKPLRPFFPWDSSVIVNHVANYLTGSRGWNSVLFGKFLMRSGVPGEQQYTPLKWMTVLYTEFYFSDLETFYASDLLVHSETVYPG